MVDPAAIEHFANVYMRGKPCPNCGFARSASTPGPRWHCPNCLNPYPQPDLPPIDDTQRRRAQARLDSTTWVLIAANAVTIAAAAWFDLRLRDLMLIYWLQSAMIGIAFVIRMVFRIRSAPHDPSLWGKNDYFHPLFFVIHYGFFHLAYLFFLQPPVDLEFVGPFGLCVSIFALNQAYSLWYNIRRDRISNVQVGTLFWLPYARILPMHATIILGPQLALPLVLFLALKTAADALMQVAEHVVLRAR